MKILIVEDHADSAEALRVWLCGQRYDVQVAGSCTEAITLGADHAFDLLLLDLGLPDGDGCELLQALTATREIPAIALTGHAFLEDVRRSEAAGFRAHVSKPVQYDKLDGLLRQLANGGLTAAPADFVHDFPE